MATTWWLEQQRIQAIVRERDELAVRVAELEGQVAVMRFVLEESQRYWGDVVEVVEQGQEEPARQIYYRWDPLELSWVSYTVTSAALRPH